MTHAPPLSPLPATHTHANATAPPIHLPSLPPPSPLMSYCQCHHATEGGGEGGGRGGRCEDIMDEEDEVTVWLGAIVKSMTPPRG